MPGTSGSWPAVAPAARRSGCRMHLLRSDGARLGCAANLLRRVHDEALADPRVQSAVGELGDGGLPHDVPDQQLVISGGQRVIVVVNADRALQPPVRGVQRVRVVVAT